MKHLITTFILLCLCLGSKACIFSEEEFFNTRWVLVDEFDTPLYQFDCPVSVTTDGIMFNTLSTKRNIWTYDETTKTFSRSFRPDLFYISSLNCFHFVCTSGTINDFAFHVPDIDTQHGDTKLPVVTLSGQKKYFLIEYYTFHGKSDVIMNGKNYGKYTNAINEVSADSQPDKIYNIEGKRMPQETKGINILVGENGDSHKVLR